MRYDCWFDKCEGGVWRHFYNDMGIWGGKYPPSSSSHLSKNKSYSMLNLSFRCIYQLETYFRDSLLFCICETESVCYVWIISEKDISAHLSSLINFQPDQWMVGLSISSKRSILNELTLRLCICFDRMSLSWVMDVDQKNNAKVENKMIELISDWSAMSDNEKQAELSAFK